MINDQDIIKQLEKKLSTFSTDTKSRNIGYVEKNNDGVVTASGLSQAVMGEIVTFENAVPAGRLRPQEARFAQGDSEASRQGTTGVIFNLNEDTVSIIALGSAQDVTEGNSVTRTEKLLHISVSEEMLGRVVDALGNPLDGKPTVKGTAMPLERIAAGVVEREPVDTPLKTGVKAIDAMIPIGRGQRELIIGDRGLGKSAIAIDAIINQREVWQGQTKNKKTNSQSPITNKRVICVYVAIGQKQSSVAQIINKLQEAGAMEYTIVVCAGASDPAAMQYLAPFAGTAIAEYFMEKGEDVLIVYDDLTKHAWAYRQLSLVLKRPAGREAYPGDIFYLHSRLLERAVKLNKKLGGGSITALPIVETQAGDISAYIPTNIISITDGQIFLVSDLFNSGIRPAIDPGNSVSRVGGSAQTGAMRSVAGKLRLELAQFRSLAAFAQFGSELDESTQRQLERGKRITEIFKQPQYEPLPEPFEILAIWTVLNGYMDDIPVEKVAAFERELREYVASHKPKVIEALSNGEKLNDKTNQLLEETIQEFLKGWEGNE